MNFRFHILDRNAVSTEVDEPVGFDALTCEIGRDANWHGIFFNNSGDTFEYYGTAYKLLKDEYELYGAQGDMTLIMEEECAGVWTEFDRGQFVFSKYERYSDDCYVKCPLEAIGEVMDLRNRVDQKVDLQSLKAFDETTDLAAYNKLSFPLTLPSKGIFMQNKADWTTEQITTVNLSEVPDITHDTAPSNWNWAWFQIIPQLDKNELSEFGNFMTASSPEHEFVKSGWYVPLNYVDPDPDITTVVNGDFRTPPDLRQIYFDWSQATALLVNDLNNNNFDSVQSFTCDIAYSFEMQLTNVRIGALYNVLVIRRKNGTYEYLKKDRIFCGIAGSGPAGFDSGSIWVPGTNHTIDYSASEVGISLSDGDYLFTVVCGLAAYSNADADAGLEAYKIRSISGSVNMQSLTHFEQTVSKVFAVNEAISRIAESVTNDKLRAYSEYFGRTDSQPYALPADGCGSLEVITDGIRIRRQEDKTAGKTNVFAQSLQDMFNGLNPVHNIGMGIETDTNRTGFNRLRVEPWDFFYNDTLVMSCTGVDSISLKTNEKEIFSTFQFGYAKWEAEEYNGLDEFLTKRNYRTSLSQIINDLSKISTFIASGYALEVTRRKGNADTKDWRYDNETFIICVKRGTGTCKSYTFAGIGFPVGAWSISGTDCDGNAFNYSSISGSGTIPTDAICALAGSIVATDNITVTEGADCGTVTDQLIVEFGNISSAANIIDPDTLYNYRISPVRNAMRWMNKVLASYRQFNTDSKIIFTDGDGNYFAQGEMTDTNCRLENAALAENVTINSALFADTANAKPILFPERVTFTYPFTAQDYINIKANPGGKIYFESAQDSGYGWIDTIQWNPSEGTATFNLIPKFTN